jgi:predicted ATPase/signal transduction histidine kinase
LEPIEGFSGLELVHRGRAHDLVRGRRVADGARVILKVLRATEETPERAAALVHEHELLRGLGIAGTARALELINAGGQAVLVLADAGPADLAHRLQDGPLGVERGLDIGIALAETLGRLHDLGVTHRDLSPENIVISAPEQLPVLVDFGLATTLTRLNRPAAPVRQLEGSLPYIAPEQTGRTGRPVDYRVDLYALGATLYHVLTGRPPFVSDDPVELVWAHLARPPRAARERSPAIPETLSHILERLLAKSPEDRYQTAAALVDDLREARARWRSGDPRPFELTRGDRSHQLIISQRLHGRERQSAGLVDAFDRAAAGEPRLVLITGPTGVGKSALSRALHQPIVARRGHLARGRFGELQQQVPYSAVAEALRGLVRQLLIESETRLAAWREVFVSRLGDAGAVVAALVPELTRIIGEQRALPEVDADDARARFTSAILAFVRVMARPEHPLCLFLDDLQWADEASVTLLRQMIDEVTSAHLLVVGTCREADLRPGNRLSAMVEGVRAAGRIVERIDVPALEPEHVEAICRETLGGERWRVRPFAELVHRKTGGNPFFIRLLLERLRDEEVLYFDASERRWAWNESDIVAVTVTDNVADLLVAAHMRLPSRTQKVLQVAACLGEKFDLSTLAAAVKAERPRIASALWPAVAEGLVDPLGHAYLVSRGHSGSLADAFQARFQFAHPRVRQVIYDAIPNDQRARIHLRVGRTLLTTPEGPGVADRLFEIVDQFNRGAGRIETADERVRLAEMNLRAATKARLATAYGPALDHCDAGITALPDDAWTAHRTLAFALHLERARCAAVAGPHALVDASLAAAGPHAAGPTEQAALVRVRIRRHHLAGDAAEAVACARVGLAALDVGVPSLEDAAPAGRRAAEAVDARLSESARGAAEPKDQPDAEDERVIAAASLLEELMGPAEALDATLGWWVAAEGTRLALERGFASGLAGPMCRHAAWLQLQGQRDRGRWLTQLAIGLARDRAQARSRSRALRIWARSMTHRGLPAVRALSALREAVTAGSEAGALDAVLEARLALVDGLIAAGRPLSEVDAEITACADVLGAQPNLPARARLGALSAWVGSMVGDGGAPPADAAALRDPFTRVLWLQRAYLFGDWDDARHWLARCDAGLAEEPSPEYPADLHFVCGLTRAALGLDADAASRAIHDEAIQRHVDALAALEDDESGLPGHRRLLLEVERDRMRAPHGDLLVRYEDAVDAAAAAEHVVDEALAHECAGLHLRARGSRRAARYFLDGARRRFSRWGSTGRAAALSLASGELNEADTAGGTVEPGAGLRAVQPVDPGSSLDVLAILRAAEALSGEVVLDRLLEKLTRIVLETGGASRVLVVLEEEGAPVVRAALSADEGARAQLGRTPLDLFEGVAHGLVHYVRRMREPLVLGDASREGMFAADPEVVRRGVRSVLAVPIVRQSRLVGVVHLENEFTAHAFTGERVEVLQMLSSQIAASIEVSTLFARLRTEIDQRRRAQSTLERLNRDLAAANQELEAFAYSASHDLQSALRSVVTFSEVLVDDYAEALDEDGQHMLRRIHANGLRVSEMLRTMLDLSKVARANLERTDIDLAHFANDAVADLRATDPTREVDVRIMATLAANGDAALMRSVMTNLVNNAWKFTGQADDAYIEVGVEDDGEARVFYVADNGAGFDEAHAGKLFSPFQRLHSVQEFEGTGVGLASVRRIIERHGGRIWAKGQPGLGATFYFTLPPALGPEASIPG